MNPAPQAAQFNFLLPQHSRVFKDHFPERPLLPAIGLLYLCDWSVQHWFEADVALSGAQRLKFLHPVAAGQELRIMFSTPLNGRIKFIAQAGDQLHARGTVVVHSSPRMEDPS